MFCAVLPGTPGSVDPESLDAPLQQLVDAARAGEPLEPVMTGLVRSFGFDSFLYTMTTAPRAGGETRTYYWSDLPGEWIAAYEAHGYLDVDPRFTRAADRTAPLVWDAATLATEPEVRGFFAHAAHYGIRSGVACAFYDPARARIGISFNSAVSPVPAARRAQIHARLGMLMLFAARFHDLFMANFVQRVTPLPRPLSPRERQCLTMAAKGLTSADIGLKLGISERTANFHFSNILHKLEVLNRHEAIAKGVATGAINAGY